MVDPTGQAGLGAGVGSAKSRGPSTARYTSRSVIAAGGCARQKPPLAPPLDSTRCALRSTDKMRRITTGVVLTLPAMYPEVSGRSSELRSVSAWTATANLEFSLMCNQHGNRGGSPNHQGRGRRIAPALARHCGADAATRA